MKQLKLDHLDFIPEEVSDFWKWQKRQMTQMRQRGMQAWKRQQGKLNQDHLNQLKKEIEKEKEEEKEVAASFKLLHN